MNGGSIPGKVDWVREHMEKAIPVSEVFSQNEVIDCIGVTKGKGFKGQLTWLICSQLNTPDVETKLFRCDVSLAHEEAAPQDPQGVAQGGVYWGVASQPRAVLCAPCRSEGLPPPHRNQQEDLPYRPGHGSQQRLHGI